MAHIESVSIDSYRSFKGKTSVGDLLVLIGENDVGKSNFVSAVSALLDPPDSLNRPEDHFGFNVPTEVAIRGGVRLGPEEREEILGTDAGGDSAKVELERRWRGADKVVSSIISEDGSVINAKKRVDTLAKALPKLVMVPPFRDVGQELKLGPRASFGRTLRPILDAVLNEVSDRRGELERKFADALGTKMEALSELARELNPRLKRVVASPHLDMSAGLDVEIQVEDQGGILSLDRKGSGVKSALVLALFRYYAKEQGLSDYLFAVEEPEAYLYPHLQRQLFAALRAISSKSGQVLITTHSPYFVDDLPVQDLRDSVAVLRYSKEGGSAVNRPHPEDLTEEDLDWIQTNVTSKNSEMLFARVALLVEGPTERFAFPILAERVGLDCNSHGISIVEVGGNNFVPFLRLLACYRIPRVVFCDSGAGPMLEPAVEAGWIAKDAVFVSPCADFEDFYPPDVKTAVKGLSKPAAGRKAAQSLPEVPDVVAKAIARARDSAQ